MQRGGDGPHGHAEMLGDPLVGLVVKVTHTESGRLLLRQAADGLAQPVGQLAGGRGLLRIVFAADGLVEQGSARPPLSQPVQ